MNFHNESGRFDNFSSLNSCNMKLLAGHMTTKSVKRRQFILNDQAVCKHYTFVAKGCFRKYRIDSRQVEQNLQFIPENEWVTEIDSFYAIKPSCVFIQAVEPSTIFQIGKDSLLELFHTLPDVERNFRLIAENRIIQLERRISLMLISSAKDRYLAFVEQFPGLCSRISNTQIASYLGITPEFLSKVRKEILFETSFNRPNQIRGYGDNTVFTTK